ncbi:MAG: glycosyltransferase family 4 protein [Candidatus Moranbacteria bacterium]|nr:glycosyltransferase family 4 protein [Candidatus Moranbacteria bacterium]
MKIGIDARLFAQGKNTGVEEFAKCFLENLFQRSSEHEYILFFNSWKKVPIDFSWATKYKNVKVKQYNIPNKLLNFSLWFLRYPKLDKLCGGVDIFYMPNINFHAISRKTKLFVTMHDLSFEHYKESFSLRRRIWHFILNPRLLCKKADKIFAVSEFTKQDIEETYHINSKKIKLAVSGRTSVRGKMGRNDIKLIEIKEKYKLPFNFILYFGTIEPRKNIVSLVKAFEILKKQSPKIKHSLVIAGASGWKAKKIYKAIDNSKFKDQIIILNDIPQEDKEALFTLSSVFVAPSFFEGFGFPALEAIACDVPTIVSHSSSLPEVTGKNAIMIDCFRAEEIALALKEILTNNKMKFILLQNKIRHLQKFDWNNTVDVFLKVSK